jgi:integrase/recombinase XerD
VLVAAGHRRRGRLNGHAQEVDIRYVVASLKVSDIDSKRMLLRIEQGKRRKDRYAMLSPVLLELLRDWWRIARPTAWLLPPRPRVAGCRSRRCSKPPSATPATATSSPRARRG